MWIVRMLTVDYQRGHSTEKCNFFVSCNVTRSKGDSLNRLNLGFCLCIITSLTKVSLPCSTQVVQSVKHVLQGGHLVPQPLPWGVLLPQLLSFFCDGGQLLSLLSNILLKLLQVCVGVCVWGWWDEILLPCFKTILITVNLESFLYTLHYYACLGMRQIYSNTVKHVLLHFFIICNLGHM